MSVVLSMECKGSKHVMLTNRVGHGGGSCTLARLRVDAQVVVQYRCAMYRDMPMSIYRLLKVEMDVK